MKPSIIIANAIHRGLALVEDPPVRFVRNVVDYEFLRSTERREIP
jgi:hypothetical protein